MLPAAVFAIEQEQLFDSTRANARGRTGIAAYDSDEGSRLNPATLKESGITYQLRPYQFDAFVGDHVVASVGELLDVFSKSDVDGKELLKTFRDKVGKRQWVKLQAGFLNQRFGAHEFSPFVLQTGSLVLGDPPSLAWKSDTITGASWSSAFMIRPSFYLGLTVRPFYRWYYKGDIEFTDLTQFLSSDVDISTIVPLRSGFGLGGDIGLIYSHTKELRLGAVVQNIGDAGYFQDTGNEPPNIKQKINLGLLKRFQLSPRFTFDSFVDYLDLMNRDGINLLRHLNLGGELGTKVYARDRDNDFGLVTGLQEGYLCYGLFLDLFFVRFDFAKYAVELGDEPGQIPEKIWTLSMRSTLTF